MDKHLIKQIFIAFVFILIISLIIFLIYYLIGRPRPSCFDGIQNQNEEGIDCGGICNSCEKVHPKEINVLWIKSIDVSNDFCNIVAKIKNNNQNYGSGNVSYTFKVYNSNGNLIGEQTGVTFILPNETKYIIQLKVNVSDTIEKITLDFDSIKWEQPLKETSQLFISQKEYIIFGEGQPYSQVKGILINKNDLSFSKVYISILLFGSEQQLLEINTTEINDLLAGQERSFIANWFKKTSNQVTSVEIVAETNIFDPLNIIKIYNGLEGSREY